MASAYPWDLVTVAALPNEIFLLLDISNFLLKQFLRTAWPEPAPQCHDLRKGRLNRSTEAGIRLLILPRAFGIMRNLLCLMRLKPPCQRGV